MYSASMRANCRLMVSGQCRSIRPLSTSPLPKLDTSSDWDNAKDYGSLPSMTRFQLVRAFAPGGKLHNLGVMEMYKTLRAEYGNVYRLPEIFGRNEILVVFNPDDQEKIFRSEGKTPHRIGFETWHYYRKNIRPEIFGEYGGLLSEQEEDWYKMRVLVNPVMMKPGIVKRYIPQVDEISQEFVEMILKLRDPQDEVPGDFFTYVNMWSLEAITNISINLRLGLLRPEAKDEKAEQLIHVITRFLILTKDFETQPPIWKFYATKKFKELMSILDDMTDIVIHYIDKAIKHSESLQNKDQDDSIFGKLVKINKKVAVVMCIDAMNAGIDTTSITTIGILYCLAKNQDKQDKLREELRKKFSDPSEALSAEKMAHLPYLRAVIKESLRFYSPTPGTVRRTTEDLVISGHQVPKGTDAYLVSVLSYQSDEHFDQAKQFLPERWLKNPSETCPMAKKTHPFAYVPFGFGVRTCIGKRVAEMEIEVLITRLIRDYKVEWNYPDMKIRSVLLNIPEGDLKFKITKI